MKVTLNKGQLEASSKFTAFLSDDNEKYFIITGGAGSGKTTLVKHLLDTVRDRYKMINLLKKRDQKELNIALTATTNKAVAVLKEMGNGEPVTIHSFLKLVVKPNYSTGETDLIKGKKCETIYDTLILIDEASFIDWKSKDPAKKTLFQFIDELTVNCKIVLIGDHYQLAPINHKTTIMESMGCQVAELTQIMRNSGIIMQTGQQFKQTVKTGIFKPIIPGPVGSPLIRVDGNDFRDLIDEAFTHENYSSSTAKILAWTNVKVIAYNNHVRAVKGFYDDFMPGEYVVTIKPIMIPGMKLISIDSTVCIESIEPSVKLMGAVGNYVTIYGHRAFLPKRHVEEKALLKKLAARAKAGEGWVDYFMVKDTWLDLRPAYASTINKSQGSTYETVFINLPNIGKCHIASDVARMVHVAITRASKRVVLFEDLPYRYRGA